MRFFIRWFITAAALAAAAYVVPGIRVEGSNAIVVLALTALVLGFVNAIIRPVLTFFSLGCIVATLGAFMLVVNAAALAITSWIAVNWFGIGFHVEWFWPAFWGSVVVSLTSWALGSAFPDDAGERDHEGAR